MTNAFPTVGCHCSKTTYSEVEIHAYATLQHFYFALFEKKKKDETKTVIGHVMENQSWRLEVGTAIRVLRVHHTIMWVKIVDCLKEDFPRID